jgi:hypothetical protein
MTRANGQCFRGHGMTKENTFFHKGRGRECLTCKRDNGKNFYKNNKSKCRKKVASYRKNNLAKCVATRKLYVLKHHDRLLEYRRNYSRTVQGKFAMLCGSAKSRKIKVYISIKDFEKIIAGNACSYCQKRLPEAGGGVDRVDNSMGYTVDNCRSCCKSCNHIKGCLEMAGFRGHRAIELLTELLTNEKTTPISRPPRDYGRLRKKHI